MRALVPLVAAAILLSPGMAVGAVAAMTLAGDDSAATCGPGGASQQIGDVDLSTEQLANAQTIVTTVSAAGGRVCPHLA